MINTTEIARGIHRISFWDEEDLCKMKLIFPGATYNMFLIDATQPVIIETMFRRTFQRICEEVRRIVDPAKLRYVIVPHHEGDSSGAVNEWLMTAPKATALCSDLCAVLSLRDFADREPRVVEENEVLDLGSHRLRFFMTPQVNQWDSLMVYEETTKTFFPNDLFSGLGTEIVTSTDRSEVAMGAARHLGYQADDRVSLLRAIDKFAKLDIKVMACMHGPAITGHIDKLIRTFRDTAITVA